MIIRIGMALLVLAFFSFSTIACQGERNKVNVMDASWAEGYNNLSELYNATDIVVSGQIVGIDNVEKISTAETRWGEQYIYVTNYKFKVDQIVKGKVPSTIIVRQTGADGQQEINGDPLFKIGDQSVVFLRYYQDNSYYVTGGPQGRFSIIEENVYSLDNIFSEKVALPEGISVNGMEKEVFIRSLIQELN